MKNGILFTKKEVQIMISAKEALQKLQDGNANYLNTTTSLGDVSLAIRKDTCENGQHPYAIIITCSDSRVIPESIFSAGIGELFVIRVAGNVIDNHQLGSIEYAADHLGCNLVVVLGHTNCGAVGAAIKGGAKGYIKSITKEIQTAIGNETNPYKACCLNLNHSAQIKESLHIQDTEDGLKVMGAVYHIDDGHVEFLS